MNIRKMERLKRLLKQAENIQAPVEFTDLVMNEISAIEEVEVSPVMKSLLKQGSEAHVPGDFTSQIMAEIEILDYRPIAKSLIPKFAWVLVTSTICLISLLTFYSSRLSNPRKYTITGDTIHYCVSALSSLPDFYYIVLITTSALFLIDYLANKRSVRFL